MATISLERNITLTPEDYEIVSNSEPTSKFFEIVNNRYEESLEEVQELKKLIKWRTNTN